MPVVDTSVLVALYNPDDEHHGEALELAKRAGPYIVPGVILSEFLSVVSFRTRKQSGAKVAAGETREVLRNLMAQPIFQIEPDFDPEAAADLFAKNEALSYSDAVAVSVVRASGHELFTFDEVQRKEATQA